MKLSPKTRRWLGWGVALAIFAYVWSAGGYWQYVVGILAGVSLLVILADYMLKKNSN